MNEAEISTKIVKPLLDSLGNDFQNFKLENSFTIKTSRYSTETFTWKDKLNHPRYDILVTVDEKNLFIVEVKKDEITPDDVEQARIYAKLLSPPAPFVVLTNGTTNRIFETLEDDELTGEIRDSKYVQNNFKIDLDDETKELALYALFSLNYENFLNFCHEQNLNTLSRLKSDTQTNNVGRYIPEIFVRRQNISKQFYDFLENLKNCFLLTGKSGIGKTNNLCNMVEEINQKNPVLFYNAGQLSEKLENEIISDLNWKFSTDKSIERLLNQIDQICKKHETNLIIIVDGIDEWWSDSSTVDISRFVEHMQDKNIKLVLSCKYSEIGKFLSINGSPSVLSQHLFIPNKEKPEKFVMIEDFDTGELLEAVDKYSKFFKLKRFWTNSETFAACKDPFLLRIISEIYSEQNVPDKLNSSQIFEKYLEMVSTKKPQGLSSISSILIEISKIMLNTQNNEIYENQLQNLNTQIFDFLIDFGLLRQNKDKEGRIKISFTFDALRNYIMIFHLLSLDNQDNNQLQNFLDENSDNEIGVQLIKWYKDIAPKKHLEVLKQSVTNIDKKLAEVFFQKFIEKIDKEFPFIRQRMTSGKELGFLVWYDKDKNFVFEFGYRCRTIDEEHVTWIEDVGSPWSSKKSHVLMKEYGMHRLVHTGLDFSNSPIDDFVNSQLLTTIKEIIRKRLLDESNSVNISLEKFFASMRHWGSMLGYRDISHDTETKFLPIDIKNLSTILEQRFSTYQPYMLEEKPKTSILTTLQESIHNLKKHTTQIDRIPLPHSDDPNYPSRYIKPSAEYFTKYGLVNYVKEFFQKFIEEYTTLVETNFPTLKDKFPTYQKLPVYVVARLHISDRSEKADGLMYAILKNDHGKNEFEIRDYDESPFQVNNHEISTGFCIKTKKGPMETTSYTSGMDIFALFHPTNSEFSDCPLTAYVYDQVEKDLEDVFGSKFKDIHVYLS